MENIKLKCKDCKKEFNFSVRDQEYYKQRGFEDPKRCYSCREDNKQKRTKRELFTTGSAGIDC